RDVYMVDGHVGCAASGSGEAACMACVQAAGDGGREEYAAVRILELVQSAFAAAVAQRLPCGVVERLERQLPEARPHRTQRASSRAKPSGPWSSGKSAIGLPSGP